MGPARLASGFSACCDSLFTIITPNSWPLEFVSLTLMVVELDLSASHSIIVPPSTAPPSPWPQPAGARPALPLVRCEALEGADQGGGRGSQAWIRARLLLQSGRRALRWGLLQVPGLHWRRRHQVLGESRRIPRSSPFPYKAGPKEGEQQHEIMKGSAGQK